MFARVTHLQTLRGKVDEAVGIFRDSVVPAAKQQKGYKSAYFFADRNTGKNIAVVYWETEADLKVNEASGYYHHQLAKFKDILQAPAVHEQYEVAVEA